MNRKKPVFIEIHNDDGGFTGKSPGEVSKECDSDLEGLLKIVGDI